MIRIFFVFLLLITLLFSPGCELGDTGPVGPSEQENGENPDQDLD